MNFSTVNCIETLCEMLGILTTEKDSLSRLNSYSGIQEKFLGKSEDYLDQISSYLCGFSLFTISTESDSEFGYKLEYTNQSAKFTLKIKEFISYCLHSMQNINNLMILKCESDEDFIDNFMKIHLIPLVILLIEIDDLKTSVINSFKELITYAGQQSNKTDLEIVRDFLRLDVIQLERDFQELDLTIIKKLIKNIKSPLKNNSIHKSINMLIFDNVYNIKLSKWNDNALLQNQVLIIISKFKAVSIYLRLTNKLGSNYALKVVKIISQLQFIMDNPKIDIKSLTYSIEQKTLNSVGNHRSLYLNFLNPLAILSRSFQHLFQPNEIFHPDEKCLIQLNRYQQELIFDTFRVCRSSPRYFKIHHFVSKGIDFSNDIAEYHKAKIMLDKDFSHLKQIEALQLFLTGMIHFLKSDKVNSVAYIQEAYESLDLMENFGLWQMYIVMMYLCTQLSEEQFSRNNSLQAILKRYIENHVDFVLSREFVNNNIKHMYYIAHAATDIPSCFISYNIEAQTYQLEKKQVSEHNLPDNEKLYLLFMIRQYNNICVDFISDFSSFVVNPLKKIEVFLTENFPTFNDKHLTEFEENFKISNFIEYKLDSKIHLTNFTVTDFLKYPDSLIYAFITEWNDEVSFNQPRYLRSTKSIEDTLIPSIKRFQSQPSNIKHRIINKLEELKR